MAAGLLVGMLVCVSAQAQDRASVTPTVTGPGYVWWEGEDAVEDNFPSPAVRSPEGAEGILSNDAWLEAQVQEAPEGGLVATWRIRVPESAEYDFWARVGWRGWAGNDWRFDGGEWQTARADSAFSQSVHFVRFRPASWTMFGAVELDAGLHTFQVRFPEGQRAGQGFDCFILSRWPFVPRGKYRPDEEIDPVIPSTEEGAGWWPFRTAYRPDQEKVMDMSFLNHPVGSHGFVQMEDGELVFEDGTPVRFWGVNASYWANRTVYPEHAAADRFAEHLAQYGVNCVRLHLLHNTNSLIDDSRDDTQHFDAEKLDRLDYLLAALKRQGIYVNLDMMFHRTFKAGDNMDPELIGEGEDESGYNRSWAAGSAAFFHPRVIELNSALYRKLLEHRNPYTGKRWLDDPAMAMLTIHNEQSIFWGTTNIHIGRPRRILNQLYTDWLEEKYGTHERLIQAWQVEGQPSPLKPGENLDTGLIELGRVGTQSQPHMRKRGLDQLRFLYHVETKFYRDTIEDMREWGVRCPIITSNWRGAGNTTRLVVQASALGEIVDRHAYWNDRRSLLGAVGRGMIMHAFDQVADRAFCISEWNAGVHGEHVAEAAPLMGAIAGFQGWDALFHFCPTGPTWEPYLGGLNVTPGHYALYPIAAVLMRRGDVEPGSLVFERRRDPESQFSFSRDERGAPPEVLAVGRVQNRYVDSPTEDFLRDDVLERYWDKEQGTVLASNGALKWHYKDEWMRLNTGRTQGAFGALAGRDIRCGDVRIRTPNEFCAVIVTTLEEKPIPSAKRLLVAAVGRSQNMGRKRPPSETPEGAVRTVPPCLMEPVTGEVAVRTGTGRVYAVDAAGYRVGEVPTSRDGHWVIFRMEGKPGVLYYEIVR